MSYNNVSAWTIQPKQNINLDFPASVDTQNTEFHSPVISCMFCILYWIKFFFPQLNSAVHMLLHFGSHAMQCKIRCENHRPWWLGRNLEGRSHCLSDGRISHFPQIEKINLANCLTPPTGITGSQKSSTGQKIPCFQRNPKFQSSSQEKSLDPILSQINSAHNLRINFL